MADERKADAGALDETSGKWWVTAPDAVAPARPSNLPEGVPEPPRQTVFEVFRETVAKYNDSGALHWKDSLKDEEWSVLTWQQYYNEVMCFGRSLVAIDFTQWHSVNIIGFNHPRWLIADLGCVAAGGLPAGIYTTNKPNAVQYIGQHSDVEVAVVEDAKQLAKYIAIADELPTLKAIVMYRDDISDEQREAFAATGSTATLYNWDQFMALGRKASNDVVNARIAEQKPGNCCTLIYTSGTTGPPKAVMISHDNATFTSRHILLKLFGVSPADRGLSYLPLSHIAAQLLDVLSPMVGGSKVYFATPAALKGELKDWLNQIQPTIFFGVPRVWEKIKEAILAKSRATPKTKTQLKVLNKAKRAAKKYNENIQFGGSGKQPCCYGLYNKLVFSKVRAALGLQHARVLATGAAPIARDTLEFFANLNMPIYEVFGQSECTGPQTQNAPSLSGGAGRYKMASAGPAVPGSFMAVMDTEGARHATGEGEVVYSGRHIMMGYMKNPEKTRETIDSLGFLHSGDKGLIDADGYLRITGRFKELIITAGGENVAPVIIEQNWKEICPAISNAMVIGDRRKYLTILLTLKVDVDIDTLEPTNKLAGDALVVAGEIGSAAKTVEEAAADPKWTAKLNEVMAAANEAGPSRAQSIKKWRLLAKDFSLPGGELTDTMKLKRSVAHAKYADVIESLYAESGAGAGAGAATK